MEAVTFGGHGSMARCAMRSEDGRFVAGLDER